MLLATSFENEYCFLSEKILMLRFKAREKTGKVLDFRGLGLIKNFFKSFEKKITTLFIFNLHLIKK
jgi:hypothetical protein